jgi:PAS domain S-box-containing protein
MIQFALCHHHPDLERVTARRNRADALPVDNPPLRDNQGPYHLMVASVKDYAIYMLDVDGHVMSWNAGAARFKGYRAKEIIGKHFSRFYTKDDLERGKPALGLQTAIAEGRFEDEGWRVRKDGSQFWADVVLTALWDEMGRLRGFSKVTRDVTERKKAEEAVLQLNSELEQRVRDRTAQIFAERKHAEQAILEVNAQLEQRVRARTAELEAANKELESFSYSVSHDLRAPLRHVQGYAEMLATAAAGQLSDKAQRYLQTISDASAEMGHLIDDLLAFSRMGRVEMSKSSVSLDQLVQETIRDLKITTQGRNIAWDVAPLPQVTGDPSMLKQVFVNLIGNAVKYTRKRDLAEIQIGYAGEEEGQAVFFVRDNGAGFDMKYVHKLFGVFQRLHRADEFEGTGIGLAIVRRTVARHGGRTWAEGKVDEGAAFYFTLQRAIEI